MDGYSFSDCHCSIPADNPNPYDLFFSLVSERGLKSAITSGIRSAVADTDGKSVVISRFMLEQAEKTDISIVLHIE